MLSSAEKMATCKLDDRPRSPHSLSPTTWSPPEFKTNWGHGPWGNQTNIEYKRSVSSNVNGRGRSADGLGGDKPFSKWGAAMLCKQHVGTREWVNCGEKTCKELVEELRHMAECSRKMLGGCKEKCQPLKDELRRFRELQPKYPTISHSQYVHWQHVKHHLEHEFNNLASDEVQAKLQALTIEECVISTTLYSPSSPVIEEPFHGQPQNFVDDDDNDDESLVSSIVELIPLDKSKLSIENGCFRKHKEWETISFLGKGTFGTTFLCYDNGNKSCFAIKKIAISHFNKEEIEIWRRLSGEHRNIVHLYGAVESGKRILIFMEYMNGGSVGDYLAANGPLVEQHALDLLQQVLCGLDFMHRNCIIHGDVKAANVLMDDTGVHVKLADFGSCVDLRSIERGNNAELVGTLIFMAPEICRSEFPSTSADIWSAMCFLVQMISGKPPWAEFVHVNAGLRFIVGSAKRPPQLPSCSEDVKEIFTRGFHVEARSRPSAAELLRHPVFALDETDMELFRSDEKDDVDIYEDDDNSRNDGSLEYHSSHSPFCSDDEYFSSLDDLDNPDVDAVNEKTSPPKATTGLHVCKRLHHEGGSLSTADACCRIKVSRDTLQCTTRLGIRCLDPVSFYQPLIDGGLYGHVKILHHVHQLIPDSQTFRKPVTVKVTLSEDLHQSEDLVVLHGRLSETKNDITWEDITDSSSVLPFEHSIAVSVTLHHFSYLLAFKSKLSILRELYLACFNYKLDLLRFMVFTRTDPKASNSHDIRLVVLRESFHTSPAADQHSICRTLKDGGFRALYGKRSEHLCPNEQLKVSLKFAHGKVLSRPSQESYTVKCPFGGEEVCRWELDTSGVEEPLSGSVTLTRSTGQDYPFQFWEHEPTRYVQDVLKLDTLEHVNMIPIAQAVGLDEVEITELVEKSSDDEEQLKEITECWHRKAENHKLASLKEFVTQVSKQAILVSDRGKFQLACLNDFNKKWKEKNDRDEQIDENEQFFKTMEKIGREMCRSALTDCSLEIDQDKIRASIDMLKSVETLFEHVKETHLGSATKKLGDLLQLLKPDEETRSTAGDAEKSRIFCEQLAACVPWLIQVVKDLFKVHVRKSPTGMWGIDADACALDQTTKTAEERLPSNEVWCQICEVLRKLCAKNLGWINEHVDLDEMEGTLDVLGMLRVVSICDKEWTRLEARLHHFRFLSKEITRNKLPSILSASLQNVLHWLQRYVKFCPTHLVQFTVFSPSTKAKNGPLKYDHDSMSFTQSLSLAAGTLTVVDLGLKIDISVNGCRYSNVVETQVQVFEQGVELNTERVTMSIVYEHSVSGTGLLKILDKSRKCLFEKRIEGGKSATDGPLNEEKVSESSESAPEYKKDGPLNEEKVSESSESELEYKKDGPLNEEKVSESSESEPEYKKGSPSDDIFVEIASKIPKEWKKLGRELLGHRDSAMEVIDLDLQDVEDKAFRMLQKWKQALGSEAKYSHLYEALCKVERKDLAEKYCLETPATVL